MEEPMYRVLIVDDEAMIRTGIKTIMPWKKLGVEQVLLAASGERAVEQLADNSVDLMITDICMINMDGLELIAKVNECHPDMRIIVLTGYSSFEYSQQCCRMNVHDFLLKPIDETELETAIAKQLDILKNRRMQQKQNRTLSRAHGLT
ncbi:MAG: response regulator, partial [Rikenellaceae bacterium]